jgi:FtsP/CotA-like multicopper oxidase with cupredoxin domain
MRLILTLLCILITILAESQIDYNKLIIGRNNGIHTFHDGQQTRTFGFTETLSAAVKVPGPTISCNAGDSVKIDFWNMSQGAPHTIHLHGLDVDQQNDGVGMLSFEVMHDEHGYYYFKAPHPGTYLYHCHVGSTIHLQAGMYGLVIVRPTDGNQNLNWDGGETFNKEFSLLASEMDTVWHNDTILDHEHDMTMPLYVPEVYNPQYFLINGLSGTQLTDPVNYLFALKNDKIYMRLANIGYYGTKFIFPTGLNARTVASDGRPLPFEVLSDTVEVLPGERYETFLQLGTEQFYPIIVEHFNLNNQIIESSQEVIIQTSSLNLTSIENNFYIFPNPSKGMFNIFNANEDALKLYTADGVFMKFISDDYIDLTSYPCGVYIISDGIQSIKIVKD